MKTKFIVLCIFCIWCIQFSVQKPERCLQLPEPGTCLARIPRLYYDSNTNSCTEFFYGGCGGNENNFETLQDCDNVCVTEKETKVSGDRCTFRPDTGNCKAMIQRMYYDSDTNTCKIFTYGGCGGNDNNFETTEQCQKACVKDTSMDASRCFLKPEPGMCRARMPRLFYDNETNTCKEFIYGGCGGNDNNFQTVEKCDHACVSMAWRAAGNVCSMPSVEGPCKSRIPRLYYDSSSKSCKEFIYSGCGGNNNNFETFGECESTCIKGLSDDICTLQPDAGNCRGMIFRNYYNSTTKKCGEFIYGGCGGNANNFETKDECEKECGKAPGTQEPGIQDPGNQAPGIKPPGNYAPISTVTNLIILIICLPLILAKMR